MNWINVKDKLPEVKETYFLDSVESNPVLVYYARTKSICIAMYYNIDIQDEDCSYKWKTDGEGWDITNGVTHWMPLPEPPKD